MTRITILVACAVFIFCFYPPIALSQLYYPPYYQLWLQSVENQAQIQELQRQLVEVGNEIGGLQKDLTSIFDLGKRLEELEISNQNTLKTLSDEFSKMQKEIGELRKKLIPQNE
jgi:chromosome segregation ATPase